MNITYRFNYGPIEVEIEGTDEEEHRVAFESVISLLEEHEDAIEMITEMQGGPNLENDYEDGVSESHTSIEGDTVQTDEAIASVARSCGISASDLQAIFDIDPDREDEPFLLVDPERLGSTISEKQMNAALALLLIWHDVYDEQRVPSSDLYDAFEYSGVDASQSGGMYQPANADTYFDSQGRGPSATVALTRRGRREAHNLIQLLVE